MKAFIPSLTAVGSYHTQGSQTLNHPLNSSLNHPSNQPTSPPSLHLSHPFLGKSKSQIEQQLRATNCQIIHFAHWLYGVEMGLILSFRHQICVQVGRF